MPPRPHVALIVETSKAFGRGILLGVSRWANVHGPWSIYVDERGPVDPPPAWLAKWAGHGVIVRAQTAEVAEVVRKLHVPVLDTLRQFADLKVPAVYSDDRAIGLAAAEHLIERHYRHLAFVGVEDAYWSDLRCEAFTLAVAGFDCHVYEPRSRRRFRASWEGGQDDLAEWLRDLPKPVGVMAAHDLRALCVLDACRRMGIAVPEQVAVIGVDDDEVLCRLADPPLSSVPHDLERIGSEAASLLAQLMQGAAPPDEPLLVKPLSVVARRSTDSVAIADPQVAAAMRFIREHACQGIRVEDVARQAGLSRRALERAFTAHLNSTPHAQICRVQMERITELLVETELSVEEVAYKAGFNYPAYMGVMFKKATKKTPAQFRSASRNGRNGGETRRRSRSG